MKNCPCCQSKLDLNGYCGFCEMNFLNSFRFRGAVDHVDLFKKTADLFTYHTFDLLLLLRLARSERRFMYDLMQSISKVLNAGDEYKKAHQEAFNEYSYFTKKVKVLEKIIETRINFIPTKVTNLLLEEYYPNQLDVKGA